MRYSLRDVPTLLMTAPGRGHLRKGLSMRFVPDLERTAGLYRRTILRRTRIVAVVGSLGKTTAVRAIQAALGREPGVPNVNAIGAIARTLLRTRPGSGELVIEAGIQMKGTMRRFARMLRPDVVVVTSIGTEHNRSLGDFASTRDEKAMILTGLRPGGVVVLNGDDEHVLAMRELTDARVVTVGFGPGNDIRALEASVDWPLGTRVRLEVGAEEHEVLVRLFGRELVYAVMAAVAVAQIEGVPIAKALGGLGRLSPMHMRLDPVELSSGAWLIRDEYKAPLESIHAALDLLAEIPAERRFVVLGDVSDPPGSTGPVYREVGAHLAEVCTEALLITQLARRYTAGAGRAGMARDAMVDASDDPFTAARRLRDRLGPGDVVLVKGRNWQRLERISLILAGEDVRCELLSCRARAQCEQCSMLHRGWEGVRGRPVQI